MKILDHRQAMKINRNAPAMSWLLPALAALQTSGFWHCLRD